MKVVKFGGSSLASASQLEKVLNIVKSDSERRFVVVSAPGKRNAEDTKVTDALIKYYRDYVAGNDISKSQSWIIDRYAAMVSELGLKPAVLEKISKSIHALATLPIEENEFLYDTFLAAGENNNAKLIAAYFNQNGIDARYMHPREAGIVVTSEPGHARIIPSSYDKIEELTNTNEVLVIPGFFGVTKENQICTFSRGGSDITGSIIAAGVKADLYENFTDVDGIFAAHPGIIHQPHSIPELTYREMRELAYAGFSVLHDEALLPAYRGKIPLVIKNTNNPDHPGTRIVLKHSNDEFPVVGIAGDSGFVSINMSKYLMNREVGFGRKVLQILEELNIGWEHMPTGIDDLSIILRSRQLTPIKEEEILRQLVQKAKVDHAEIEHDLSIIMIVGEKMKSHIGVTATATRALSENKINIQMMSQGSSEVSIMFVVNKDQEKAAIKALYNAFFGESKVRKTKHGPIT
ncbi:TPA: aspartate kinase [Streptococcus pneumoniae]|nr:aspartate kinase [Streptococcus pneumoniae]HEU9795073.1 aspartate kinase [Streptococcus pneumoniae]HEV0187700.1 aspartate kinase [Streptococcus pneumoniae]HEV0368536.1 aspartate kinase [Streptococcus pneumoniae]HEV0373732.1 aspartate kinase [Streptococcus pneumoniae]